MTRERDHLNPQQRRKASVSRQVAQNNLADCAPVNSPPVQSVSGVPLMSDLPPRVVPEALPQTTPPLYLERPPMERPRRRRLPVGFLKTWQFWSILGTLGFIGTGVLAAAILLKLPAIPNCPSIFWPTASASLRLYCAQLAANKQNVDDLLAAIALVKDLPPDHPLRPEVDRSVELWSQEILELADDMFHAGDLQGAISVAKRIPQDTSAHGQVSDRITAWEKTWSDAEKIYQQAEAALLNQDPRKAFDLAVQLLDVGNRYWETTKYQELNDLITASREDGNRLGNIRRLMSRGGLANLLQAIKLVQEIKPSSPAYPAARRTMTQIGQKMLDLAEDALARRDFNQALDILQQIPAAANLQEEAKDFNLLAQAQAQAWNGTVSDLESAIFQAQRVGRDRPLYGRAQRLIARWQLEIQDVMYLDMARQFAGSGSVDDLRSAIANARQVPPSNPRYDEARGLIRQWTREIEQQEDRPLLDQAEQLAASGNLSSIQTAVNMASQIREGRALYNEARSRIRTWTQQIQEAQDQPILARARQLAAGGNIPEAIAVASRIQAGRALYDEAQNEIQNWRVLTEGESRLQQAIATANVGSPSTLLDAIRIADRVPPRSPARPNAERLMNQWSVQVLRAAQGQAAYDLAGAIALLEAIPQNTEAYAEAQLQRLAWQQQSQPATE